MALTLTTEAEIIRRAGAGASPTITASSALVTEIGETAEGELIADTRRDWITNFADVNSSVKKLISRAVSCKAAKEIVANDGKNYFSRLEQETILDVLHDEYNNAVKTLKELDANKIRGVND